MILLLINKNYKSYKNNNCFNCKCNSIVNNKKYNNNSNKSKKNKKKIKKIKKRVMKKRLKDIEALVLMKVIVIVNLIKIKN